ncbi:Macrophage colony-stimulating factor 1 receptor [Recurvomyces mirabilis]|uniref:Macrophage colony-stimulating factor 1 receptor n=1 Tax=Recurvomyces mirabilis TaxID=574656 RepID=UPI002DDF22D6|nr:Macrophage colony-stimulating factor 1 receptor [Recurvomyces mirabilis]
MVLSPSPLGPSIGFNWVYLVEILVSGILAVFFLFYFNRLFGTVVSYAIRAWTWHKYRAYIDITALQISLLGGRIFFKSIRYHAHNITATVHDGHITWRYWLSQVQDAEIFLAEETGRNGKQQPSSGASQKTDQSNSSPGEKHRSRSRSIGKTEKAGGHKKELPCRISVKVSGVEAFIYNRSPLYDLVVEATSNAAKSHSHADGGDWKVFDHPISPASSSQGKDGANLHPKPERVETHQTGQSTAYQRPEIPQWLRIFPVKVECRRAAAAVGNEHTTSVITAKIEKATGTIDADNAATPFDIFKLLFNFDIEHATAQMKPNKDFKKFQLDFAQHVLQEKEGKIVSGGRYTFTPPRPAANIVRWLRESLRRRPSVTGSVRAASVNSHKNHVNYQSTQPLPGAAQWHGLSRYLDEHDSTEHSEWSEIEYAKASTLVECPKIGFRFYWDIPGTVPGGLGGSEMPSDAPPNDDINGSKPPDYGLDFFVHGGTVVYGPWADRQRINLQQIFFPVSYVDSPPMPTLKAGDTRICTVFKIFVSVEEDVTLRVPTRELSKDDQWQGRADQNQAGGEPGAAESKPGKHGKRRRHHRRRRGKQGNSAVDARPYGWLDITVKPDTTVNFSQDMYPRASGYRNRLDLEVKGSEMTSSVNHGLLWRTGLITLDADISQPLAWSTLRRWPFNIVIYDMELFILRDHMFLIIDIVNDWSSGASPEFFTFVPYYYDINMGFKNWCMFLNVNDANIINEPASFDHNDFVTLEGLDMRGAIHIPMEHYRPKRNEIYFDVLSFDMGMRTLSPPRSTLHTFLREKRVADLPHLTLNGSFDQNSEEKPGLVDILRFDIASDGLSLKAFGQLVRQLINIKENYFGDYVHFNTLEEFQSAGDTFAEANEKIASAPPPQTINELDVILNIIIENTAVMFPTNLYSGDEHIRIELPHADLNLRIVSYYLDMALQLSPLSILSGSIASDEDKSPIESASSTQLFIRHLDLYGHRSFGAPPKEPAYVNQWDIDVGAFTGECNMNFMYDLVSALQGFAFAFIDAENATPVTSPNIFSDVSFVRVRTDIIRTWLHVGQDALLFAAQPISVDTNDLAGERFSQRVNVVAPLITLACIDAQAATRSRAFGGRRQPARTFAFVQTGAAVDVLIRKRHFEDERQKQQAHIRECDMRTRRVPFLLHRKPSLASVAYDPDLTPPAMAYPFFPIPLTRGSMGKGRPASIRSAGSGVSSISMRSLMCKESSSSISASLRGPTRPKAMPMFRSIRSQEHSHAEAPQHQSDAATNAARGTPDRSPSGLPAPSMAFSSPFAEPYFPLDLIEPDETNLPVFSAEQTVPRHTSDDDTPESIQDIGDPDVDSDASHTSVLITVNPGIRMYAEPRVATTAAKLMRKMCPKDGEDLLDGLHMSVMGTIDGTHKAQHGHKDVLEIQASLPCALVRVVNSADDEGAACDQLDLSINKVEQLVRIRKSPTHEGYTQALALHSIAAGVEIALTGISEDDLRPAVRLHIRDILVWVSLANNRSMHVSVRDAHLSIVGTQARYLSDAALRVMHMVEDLVPHFGALAKRPQRMLLLLVYALTQHNESFADPAFLSRMTYILRAFPDHFRNQNSWKVLSRLRHILYSLPAGILQSLNKRLEDNDLECPPDMAAKVLRSWEQWRSWDVVNVDRAYVFQTLFPQAESHTVHETPDLPLSMIVRTETLSVSLESRTQPSEIVVEELSLGVDITPPIAPTGLMLVEANKRTKSMLQLHTSSIGMSFDWSLCGIVEDVLPLVDDFEGAARKHAAPRPIKPTEKLGDELNRHDFHIVMSTDEGNISLQTINLRHLSRAEGLKLSVIGTTQASDRYAGYGQCVTALLNVDRASTELHGPTSRVWQSLLTSPSLYIDHLQPAPGVDIAPAVVVAAAYDELDIALQEQISGIIHVVDGIIVEEVTQVMRLVKVIKAAQSKPSTNGLPPSVQSKALDLNVAVLAGHMQLEVAVLQSLSYYLEGKAASMRLVPSFTGDKSIEISFEIDRQNHSFINTSRQERHHQGLLEIPPINGHVNYLASEDEISISASISVEKIEIEAAAIQGVISVVNKPEVKKVISAVKGNVEEIQRHIEALDLPPKSPPLPTSDTARKTLYDMRLALLGIRVSASTPRVRGRSTAEVEIGIGPLHVTASNRHNVSEVDQMIPEVHLQLQDIGARLWVDDRGKHHPCGKATFGINVHFILKSTPNGNVARELNIISESLEVNAYPETASTFVDVINHLQDRLRDLDVSRELEYIRRLRDTRRHTIMQGFSGRRVPSEAQAAFSAADLLALHTTVTLRDIHISWLVNDRFAASPSARVEDAVLTFTSITLMTSGGHEARLTIADVLLQLTKKAASKQHRALNSALLPEVAFSVGYWTKGKDRSLAFKATGKPLDLRLESSFIIPVNAIQKSVEYAMETFQSGTAVWQSTPTSSGAPRAQIFDTKRLASLLVEADFAGAQVYMKGAEVQRKSDKYAAQPHGSAHGRYGQFANDDETISTTLRAPGIAVKVEYNSKGLQPTISGEMQIEASSNQLLPNFVPLMVEVSNSVKDVVRQQEGQAVAKPKQALENKPSQKFFEEDSIATVNPARLFGRTKVNLGLRICRQEFGLTCQPIAKVDAKLLLDDFYFTVNTIESDDYGHFFAMSAVLTKLSANVKHVYSREPTFSFDMDSIVLSAMNSKHLSGNNGISAIVKVNPTKLSVNAKQLQDLLLFQEIWLPPEIRAQPAPVASAEGGPPDEYFAQKYHSLASAAAFPWNATVTIAELNVNLDLGQSIGKTSATISNLWASQQKSSNWEEHLCIGLDELAVNSTGRMSGFVELTGLGVRTSIQWPQGTEEAGKTPLIQASAGFGKLRAKAAFDYQAFAFGDIEDFDFLMYNVRQEDHKNDRLVAVLDCGKAYVFCTSTSPAQAVGLFQAFDRLIQEKQLMYTQSLKDIEKHLRRESTVVPTKFGPIIGGSKPKSDDKATSISLHTDVVATLGDICFGVYPSTFFDSQLLKGEANNIQARFAVGLENGKIHSGLGMTLGQLQVALAAVRRVTAVPKALEVSVDEVVSSALNAKGGTILRVPKVVASMQTWQAPNSNNVDYIFKSLFAGKIDVGWNLSRINFIQGMWTTHSRALASRLGKQLPESAVKITAAEQGKDSTSSSSSQPQDKITAEVKLPQSRYEYHALEPPIIETPQLRDMGEATPPLEWIGLQRGRLPNVTHQIIIVGLLEVAKEVEDAYSRILGSS